MRPATQPLEWTSQRRAQNRGQTEASCRILFSSKSFAQPRFDAAARLPLTDWLFYRPAGGAVHSATANSKRGKRVGCPNADRMIGLQLSQVHHVHISAEPHVVGQVPAHMTRVIVNYDIVRIPVPAVAIGYIRRRNAPIPVIERKAAGTAARQVPPV